MAQQALIDKALKYRLIKQVFSKTGKMSKLRILKFLKYEYPMGLSDKYAKAAIQFADKAISKITEKPRIKGMAIGTIISSLIMGAWFFVPLRKFIENMSSDEKMYIDTAIAIISAFIAYYTVRIFAGKALKQFALSGKTADKDIKQILPPAKNQGIYAIFATILIFMLLAYFSPNAPIWLSELGLK